MRFTSAYLVTGARFRRVVVAESAGPGPLFQRDDLTHDRPASFMLDADGRISTRCGKVYAMTSHSLRAAPMPEWAREGVRGDPAAS